MLALKAGIYCQLVFSVFFLLGWGVMDLVYCESVLGILYIRASSFVWAGVLYFYIYIYMSL